MGAYDSPKIIRDRSGEIYGQAIANFGQQVGAGLKANYLKRDQEAEKANKEIERQQRIGFNIETQAYDLADRNYALVSKEDPGLAQGFKDEVYTLLRGDKESDPPVMGAIQAQTLLQTKTDLTDDERTQYRTLVQNAKTFQNNAIAGGGKIMSDLEDMKGLNPDDMASTHYWIGANDVESDTSMLTGYALGNKKMSGVESSKKIYSGPNGEMIVEVNSKVEEGSEMFNLMSPDMQEHLKENNFEVTWKRDMNDFEELIGEVPKGLEYDKISENSKFQKDGSIQPDFIVGGGEGTIYETKDVNLEGKEIIKKGRFIDVNKLKTDPVFTADIKGKASGMLKGYSDGEIASFMKYKMKDGGFKIQDFRKMTGTEQRERLEEALTNDFIREKTSAKGMEMKISDQADVDFYANQDPPVTIGVDEEIYFQNMGETLVASGDQQTAAQKNQTAAEQRIVKANETLSVTLQEQSIPTFSKGVQSEGAVEFIETVQKFPNISINAKDTFTVGPNQGFKIQGLKTTVTVHSGMTEPELKEAIMFANGATAEEIKNSDFNKKTREAAEKKKNDDKKSEMDLLINPSTEYRKRFPKGGITQSGTKPIVYKG